VPWDELYTPENFFEGDFDPDKALEAVKALTAGISSIENQLKDIETRVDMNDINYQKTKDEVVIVLQDIRDTNTNMVKRLKRLQTYKKFAEYAKDQLKTLKNEMTEFKAYIVKFTQFLYKLNNELYDENFKLDEVKLFLKSENIAQSLSQEAMMESLVGKMNELVGEMDKKQTTLIKLIQKINRLKAESIIEIQEHKTQFENLTQKRRYLQEFLELYKLERIKFQGEIKNLFDTRKDVQKDFLKLSEEINNGKYNVGFDMGEAINKLVSLPQYSRREHALFAWPVLPVKSFGALFKDKTYKEKFGIENLGVELITPQMSPVYAGQDGIVVKVVDADGITLNRVALLHTNGYMSQYAYMNKVIVKEGSIVRRGELL
jgi:murein DD-endopeptidase MepM/ murein hydrolase activator NlpD